MKKFLVIVAVLILFGGGALFSMSQPAPASDFKNISVAPTSKEVVIPDEQWSVLFCLDKMDMTKVRDTYVAGGDNGARKIADSLVAAKRCDYRATVITTRADLVACDPLPNGYCIAVQPAFTCPNDEPDCELKDAIHGYDLEEPRVSSGKVPPNTQAMNPVRTIIFNPNF